MNRNVVRLLLFTLAAAALLLGGATLPEGTARAQDTTETDTTETDAAVAADRAALVALYDSTDGGSRWRTKTHWLSERPLDDWHGVTTNDAGRVTGLRLTRNRMRGTLPAELGNLSELRSLNLSSNLLRGSIPAELGNLSNLTYLNLSSNGLTGPIPVQLGGLEQLTGLNLESNGLSGRIPSQLGGLSNLVSLNLYFNFLSGPIPSQLSNLTNLEEMNLADNQLSGLIPPELGNLGNLQRLYLYRNGLDGSLPAEFSNLGALEELSLQYNRLAGPLPQSLTALNLERLKFEDTNLCAPTDNAFQSWYGGIRFRGGDNCLTEREALVALYNATGGPNWTRQDKWLTDAPISQWQGVQVENGQVVILDLGVNNLRGTLPPALLHLPGLHALHVELNHLEGPVPDTLAELPHLTWVFLRSPDGDPSYCAPSHRYFRQWVDTLAKSNDVGQVPFCDPDNVEPTDREILVGLYDALDGANWRNNRDWRSDKPIGRWHGVTVDEHGRVTRLDLRDNNLAGQLPAELGGLEYLTHLFLSTRRSGSDFRPGGITGAIPAELGNLHNLQQLALDGNHVSGSLPSTLGNPAGLQSLSLNRNELTGTLPSELGYLRNLRVIGLARNDLEGSIPASLGNLGSLERLSLHDNTRLSGALPAEIGDLSGLQRLAISNTGLSGPLPAELTGLTAVSQLFFDGTELCAPTDGTFQQWLDGIAQTRGADCASEQ